MMFLGAILLVCATLTSACQPIPPREDGIYEVVWTTSSYCVEAQCRLQDSATLRALTDSCARERCSYGELAETPSEKLASSPLAILFMEYNAKTVDAVMKNMGGILDMYAMVKASASEKEKSGSAWVLEFGKKVTEEPVNVLEGLLKGTMGGIRNPVTASDLKSDTKHFSMRVCGREFRRNAAKFGEESKMSAVGLLEECLGKTLLDDTPSEEGFRLNQMELWDKAQQLGVVLKERLTNDPFVYAEQVWNEFFNDGLSVQPDVWLSVSWVPVFESYHNGLGHGDRSEALLLELVHVEAVDPERPTASAIIRKKSGPDMRVVDRRFFSLVACEDDDLESVLSCLRRATPNIFRVSQIVWGMGFVGDYKHYQELEQDWNGDEAYTSHGQMLPKYEDNARRAAKDRVVSTNKDSGAEGARASIA